jgi:flagellar hook assembly protein FlgD
MLMATTLMVGFVAPPPSPAVAITSPGQTVVISSFDLASNWSVVKGAATLTTITDPDAARTAVRVSSVDAAQRLELAPARGPAEIQGLPQTLLVDVKGTSGWRPLYLQVRDATGEIFIFWIGHIASDVWQTVSIDLTAKPAGTTWGDADGILDLPISFSRIVAGTLPDGAVTAVDFALDNLRMVVEPWTPLALRPKTFIPSAGGSGVVTMSIGQDGPFVAVLRDEGGRTRTWAGSSSAGVSASFSWNGRDNAGSLMQGSIQARLSVGAGDDQQTVDVPYLGGLLGHPAADPNSIVGLNTFLSEVNPSRRAFVEWQARRLDEARVSQIRETFIWNRVEPRKGSFEWAKFDQAVEIADAHGIDVLGVLAYSADWASSAPSDVTGRTRSLYPPTNPNDFANYVTAVVRRYRDRIDEWEIWNEPNHPAFWYPHPNPEAYAVLLDVAAQVIRREDPGALIVLGGIVGTDVPYLDRLRAAGAWTDFDVLAIHGFVRLSPEQSGLGGWFDKAAAYVQKYGVKPIWMTEICWPISDAEPGIPAVTASSQAAFLGRTFARAAEAGVARVFWYNLVDHPSGVGSRYDACGLFDAQQQARPTFAALRTIGAAFDGSVTMGTFDPAAASRKPVDASASAWTSGSGTGNSVVRVAGGISAKYAIGSATGSAAFATSLKLPGRPTSISATITGDGSANSILAYFQDATGESCSVTIGRLRSGSRPLRVPLDGSGANWNCWGGDGDHALDAPVSLRSVSVYPTGIGPMNGSFRMTGLAIGEGPVDNGLVLAHGRTIRLLASRVIGVTGATSTISLPGSTATELVNGTRRSLTVTSGVLHLGVSPQIRVVEAPIGMTSPSITPGTWSWLRWIAGDGTRGRPQVVRADGSWVRTDMVKTYSAGLHSISWDGRVVAASGVKTAAPAGSYTVRLVVTAPDGRTGILYAPIQVR